MATWFRETVDPAILMKRDFLQRVVRFFQGYTFFIRSHFFIRRRSQVVRQLSAKQLFTGSSPVVASRIAYYTEEIRVNILFLNNAT